ncbi:MAG: hypothetical protein S4CHLAM45_08070 [Chlamydiales bacterium]|nr:hypothetical protein [Chlamydiales bacterium]MCH9620441.1 hypothetical protein [Chlamydiales bacterium]MCH9622913.1 hypothetical protein [Chlamydiales bacterium]
MAYASITTATATIQSIGSFFTNGQCCGSKSGQGHIRNLYNNFTTLTEIPADAVLVILSPSFHNKEITYEESVSVTRKLTIPLAKSIERCSQSTSPIHRHVTARLGSAVLIVARVITRLFDFLIGLLSLAATTITLGQSRTLNIRVIVGFRAVGALVADILTRIALTINPRIAPKVRLNP